MTIAAALAALALAAPLPAGPLVDLSTALARLGAATPVRARVEHRFSVTLGDEKPGPEGRVTVTAAAGPDGLQVGWSPTVLAEADREAQRRIAEPEAVTPVRDALFDLKPLDLAHALDAAPELLRALQQAELVERRAEVRDGAPVTLLILKVTPALGSRERRYVKEVAGVVRLWLSADGLPVAAEQEVKASGRAFLVVTFESVQQESFRFARVGDRLVVIHHETEQRSAGAGDKSRRRTVTDLEVLP
jgi:hypothetical protein